MEKRYSPRGRRQRNTKSAIDGYFDFRSMEVAADNSAEMYDSIIKLGEKYVKDRTALEEEYERVEQSSLSASDKQEILSKLEAALEELQERYTDEVISPQKNVEALIRDQIDDCQDASDDAQEQVERLHRSNSSTRYVDLGGAADAAELKKKQYDQLRKDQIKRFEDQINQANHQKKTMLKPRLGHK